jgi:D-alanyl-D-alanine dipeptidase
LSDLELQSTQLSADLRHLSHELHPGALEHLGLLEALANDVMTSVRKAAYPCSSDVSEAWRDVSDALALCLYRVAQEALRNVATHAKAQNVTLSLEQLERPCDDACHRRWLRVRSGAKSRRLGFGPGQLERARAYRGGALDVTAAPALARASRSGFRQESRMRPKVLLADDHAIIAEGLARSSAMSRILVGQVNDGVRLVEEVRRLRPDIVVT